MKLKVNTDLCIGCGACCATCPECFEFDEDGHAICTTDAIPEANEDDAIDAKEGCPTSAIEEIK